MDKKNIQDILSLTPTQEGILYHYLKEPQRNLYFVQLCLEIASHLDIRCFTNAWNFVVKTNEMLRASFRWEQVKAPLQIILKESSIQLQYHDLSDKTHSEKVNTWEKIKKQDRETGFHLKDIPFRITLGKMDDTLYQVIISHHHILYDGWSNGIILREFFDAYHELSRGVPLNQLTPPRKTRFKNFVKWLGIQEQDKGKKTREAVYWKEYLADFQGETAISLKKEKIPGREKPGENPDDDIQLEPGIGGSLTRFIARHNITPAVLFYGAWALLLQKYCNCDDVIFGVTVSGRSAKIPGIEHMVGLFINTLPLRVRFYPGESITDMLRRLHHTLRAREAYESTPLIKVWQYSREGMKEEPFNTIVVVENYPLDIRRIQQDRPLTVSSYSIMETAHYDLSAAIHLPGSNDIRCSFQSRVFEQETLQRLGTHFLRILEVIIENPLQDVFKIDILSSREKHQILEEFNSTDADYPQDKPLHQLFEEQAAQTPDSIAAVAPRQEINRSHPTHTTYISYRQLNESTNRLAHLLQARGIGPDIIAAIMTERSLEMVIGILAILKAGGAYMPIDPDYPEERRKYMLKDSGAKILLTADAINRVTTPQRFSFHPSTLPPFFPSNPSNLAYIIYTSGSTGRPKGVLVQHSSVVNLILGRKRYFQIDRNERILLFASICFDASVEEIFITLSSGAVLVLIYKETLLEPGKFEEFILKQAVTHIDAVPSFLVNIKLRDGSPLKRIISGAEACPASLAKKFSGYCDFYNAYGPTETTVTATCMKCERVDEALSWVPLGKPVDNTVIYLFDQWMKLVPPGVAGEIYIGGKGVTRGYLNNPGLTAEKFCLRRPGGALFEKTAPPGPPRKNFLLEKTAPGKTIYKSHRTHKSYKSYLSYYKTGDRARWLPDGNLQFLGRIDHQVKIRGFRIEPGEIETQVLQYSGIKKVVVIAREGANKEKYLCAYIVPGKSLEIPALRLFLKRRLPGYMIPSYIIPMEALPLNTVGKIDRGALPLPFESRDSHVEAPGNVVEKQLAGIWADVLGIPENTIGIDDDFFDRGGHSLKATVLINQIHKVFKVELPLSKVFKEPSICGIARLIQQAAPCVYEAVVPVEKREYYPQSSAQKRMFILNRLKGEKDISDNVSEMIMVRGKLNRRTLEQAVKGLIGRHEAFRTSFLLLDNQPVQVIHEELVFNILYMEARESDIDDAIEGFIRHFNLAQAPLLRVGLLGFSEEKHLLLFDMHHIIMDGVSMGILAREFVKLYYEEPLPRLILQYKDFTLWQDKYLRSAAVKKQEAYWLDVFSGALPVLNLPTDYPRPAVQDFEGDYILFEFSPQLTEKVQQMVSRTDTTVYMVLLAVYNILLSRYSGQEDIIVGTPIAGRRQQDLESIMGLFVNTLAMRNYPEKEKSFQEFLEQVKSNSLKAYENQDYQFEALVDALGLERDPARSVLFDTMFVVQNVDMKLEDKDDPYNIMKDLQFKPYPYQERITQFDIITHVFERRDQINFKIRYRVKLFKRQTIERLFQCFRDITGQVTSDANIPIPGIRLYSQEQLLFEFNQTQSPYPADKTLGQLFEEQAAMRPDSVALVGQSARKERSTLTALCHAISYRELNRKSNQWAWFLKRKGMGPGRIVALMTEPSLEMMMALLGILKVGGIYLPIAVDLPQNRVIELLRDSGASLLLTWSGTIDRYDFLLFQDFESARIKPHVTPAREPVKNLDKLQKPDRSLVDYQAYGSYIGQAMMKNDITVQFSRGCVYHCAYCFKVSCGSYHIRSAENMFDEIRFFYHQGFRRFAFVDDLPNLHVKESSKFYRMIIDNGMKMQLHYVNGIRGDILTRDYIDLMVEAGTVVMDLALETTSRRLQGLIKKNLNLDKLHENFQYIIEKHPQVILETAILHGIPTETEEEALASLEYLKSLKWIHFPYIHLLKIYPHTEMEKIALNHGISPEAIRRGANLAYHEIPETIGFTREFTRQYQSEFLKDYFLSTKRLLKVLPVQMKVFSEDELVQAYDGYLPVKIAGFSDILDYAGIGREEVPREFLPEDYGRIENINETFKKSFPEKKPRTNALKVMLLDLSQAFSQDRSQVYDVVEPPLGLMYLLTHLHKTFADRIEGKILKSRIDFDSFARLKTIVKEFQPAVIGIRSLNYYKRFFHRTVSLLRQWGVEAVIVAGGPYASASYTTLLKDKNVDLAVLGEGEIAFSQLMGEILENNGQLPDESILKTIPGLAFVRQKDKGLQQRLNREILLMDEIPQPLPQEIEETPGNSLQPTDLAYVIYTSGSTGKPKGVLVRHNNLVNQLAGLQKDFALDSSIHYMLLTALTFDVSLMHIFSPLTTGAKLFLPEEQTKKDPVQLWQFVLKKRIDILNTVPAFMELLLRDLPAGVYLRYLFIGGDILSKELYSRLARTLPAVEIINIYGPTETTINAALYRCRAGTLDESAGTIPIGKPLPNYRIYILDRNFSLAPIGAVGELCIAGAGTARGYLNNPELTKEKFCLRRPGGALFEKTAPVKHLDSPRKNFSLEMPRGSSYRSNRSYRSYISYLSYKTPGKIHMPRQSHHLPLTIYRTGDLASWLPDGNIEFHGRIDRQVKIRGIRIEPGEIENRLLAHERIQEAIVTVQQDNQGNKRLCAYYRETRQQEPQLWPSIGEYFIWDDLMYYAMTHDESRNKRFQAAINRHVRDKVVLDVGTGRDAVLARFCAQAGAKKVYAVELLEQACQAARQTVKKLGLQDKIQVIQGDITKVKLPGKVDVCVANQCGTIGSSEGAIILHNIALRHLEDHGVVIPAKCITKMAAISLPAALHSSMGFAQLPGRYVEKIFQQYGHQFDLRLCIKNFPRTHIVSTTGVFENLNFSEINEIENSTRICLTLREDAVIDGFLLWLNLYTFDHDDGLIDTLAEEYVWLPLLVPVFSPAVKVTQADTIEVECLRTLSENGLSPDYRVRGKVKRARGEDIEFDYGMPRVGLAVQHHPFYEKLFNDGKIHLPAEQQSIGPDALRDYLSGQLPGYMVPSDFIRLEKFPMTAAGKIDIHALPGFHHREIESHIDQAPRDNLEKKLAEIWGEVLQLPPGAEIGIDNNFFHMGGNSLSAIVLTGEVHKIFDIRIPLATLFQSPTIGGLARYIRETAKEKHMARHQHIPIQPVEEKEYYKCSFAQKRLYIEQQKEIDSMAYNMPVNLELEGEPDKNKLERVFKSLLQRHENLRTSFEVLGDNVVQKIHRDIQFEIKYYPDPKSQELRVKSCIDSFIRPFDLSRAPLLRVGMIELPGKEDRYLLMVDMHHIITDGISMAILVKEFSALYPGRGLPAVKTRYRDFSEWQNRLFRSPEIKKQEEYWLKQYEDNVPVSDLPTDYPRSCAPGFKGETFASEIDGKKTAQIRQLVSETGTTLHILLLAVFTILISKYSGQEDIVVGFGVSGRRHSDLEHVMGMFVNMTPARNQPQKNMSFIEFLQKVKTNALDAYENQDYPFEELLKKLNLQGKTGTRPFFDVVFQTQNVRIPGFEIKGLAIKPYEYDENKTIRFNFLFTILETGDKTGDRLDIRILYSPGLFKPSTVQKIAENFREVIDQVLDNNNIQLEHITISNIFVEVESTIFKEDHSDFTF